MFGKKKDKIIESLRILCSRQNKTNAALEREIRGLRDDLAAQIHANNRLWTGLSKVRDAARIALVVDDDTAIEDGD